MDILTQILVVLFSPFTILGKFIEVGKGSDYLLTFLGWIGWIVGAIVIAILFVSPTASPIFYILSTIFGYLFSVFFYYFIDGKGDNPGLNEFLLFVLIGLITGYAFGMLGHAFFLLY